MTCGTHPLPATGPYVIASYRPNTRSGSSGTRTFHEWSKAAQPDGYPDQIVFEIGDTPDEAVNDVIDGKADAFGSIGALPSRDLLDAIQTRFASRVHTNPYQRDLRPLPEHPRSRRSTVSTCAER